MKYNYDKRMSAKWADMLPASLCSFITEETSKKDSCLYYVLFGRIPSSPIHPVYYSRSKQCIFRIPCNLERFDCTDRRTVWLACMSEEGQDFRVFPVMKGKSQVH